MVESLLLTLDAEKVEGNGSAVTFFLNGQRADFHRPHPQKEALKYRIKALIGQREGLPTAERDRLKALGREVRELRKANEILRLASAFFAQAELDRRFK